MKKSTISILSLSAIALTFWSCTKESPNTATSPNLAATPYDYSTHSKDKIEVIGWFNATSVNTAIGSVKPSTNSTTTVTNGGATLGMVIFYDNVTSLNLANSCNRCHATPPHMPSPHRSVGLAAIQNADKDIKDQMAHLSDRSTSDTKATTALSVHSGLVSADALIVRMDTRGYYGQLFKNAFGTSDITPERINEALTQYLSAAAEMSSEQLAADVRFANPFVK